MLDRRILRWVTPKLTDRLKLSLRELLVGVIVDLRLSRRWTSCFSWVSLRAKAQIGGVLQFPGTGVWELIMVGRLVRYSFYWGRFKDGEGVSCGAILGKRPICFIMH